MDLRTEPVHHADFRESLAKDPSGSILRFENVSVSFDGEVRALDSVSFDMKQGKTRILFGAAGSGKSVLIKTAIGLLRPSSGRVWLFGNDITDMDEEEQFEIRSGAGVLFQESGLFDSLTVGENVAYPLRNQRSGKRRVTSSDEEIETRVHESLRFVELEQTVDKFPSELSGGMRRRVGIARAAVTQPPLMLYDSPTAGLDPITANTIVALIIKARDTRETSSVIVTHRLQDGQMMANFGYDRDSGKLRPVEPDSAIHRGTIFMVFCEGRLVFEGTQEELEKTSDPYVAKFKTGRR
jgi:phospholipid/cholesterol/gamma-HCH transport system ATP-binding protein